MLSCQEKTDKEGVYYCKLYEGIAGEELVVTNRICSICKSRKEFVERFVESSERIEKNKDI